MKKLMIAAVAVAVAACAQAAAFTWKTSAAGKIYQPDTTTLLASGSAYLFDASAVTQASLVEAFASSTLDLTTGGISTATINNGAIGSTAFNDSTAVGDTLTAYFATLVTIGDDDYLYVGPEGSGLGQEGKSTQIQFNAKASSQAAAFKASEGYQGAGWYAVPEPTSGLLMLIGMAGLALRRRRA